MGRVLKKRGTVLKKRSLVRGTGGGWLLRKGGFLRRGAGCGSVEVLKEFDLEAQQRYFSYRAIFVAIVSQNCFVLVFKLMGYRTIIARYVAKWGIAQMCLCKTKYQGGDRTILGE